tara:strand:- start:1877 stop:2437 length:561 start_codon:yes stop_codon:yes gene_type:complete
MSTLLVLILTSCASHQDQVLQTMEDIERPEWATLSQTIHSKGGKLYAVGYTEGQASNRISALMRISDNNARYEFSREITNQMNFIYQNLEEGVSEGGQLSRFYGTEVSKFLAHGIRQEKRYWEKVKTFDAEGEPTIRLRIYSLISIRESDMKKAIRQAINDKKEITKAIKQKIDDHMVSEVDKMMQ